MTGTPGRSGGSRERAPSPPVELGRPVRPDWLDDVAATAWERLADLLERRGTLSPIDADAITLAATAEAEYRAAVALVREHGVLAYGGGVRPAVRLRESAWKRWSTALTRLGLDPASRRQP